MSQAKTPRDKRATPPRSCGYTKGFPRDWERLDQSGRFDMRKLKRAMLLLIANDAPLDPEWRDHPLTGDWGGHRECHAGGDFLLIYQIVRRGTEELVLFVRTGTHSQLFRE